MLKEKGFTLLEVVMVIAIIAVLISILAPRGLTAYKNAQLDSVVASQSLLKTAVGQSFVKNKKLFSGGTAVPNNNIEGALITEGSMSSFIANSISLGSATVNTYKVFNPCPPPISASFDGLYDINANGASDTCGQSVVEIQVSGLTNIEGRNISLQIDGTIKSTALGFKDVKGKVKFSVESPAKNDGVAFILVEHN